MPSYLLAAALLATSLSACQPTVAYAQSVETLRLLDELRRHFTMNNKPVPPEIFRDFGDGNLADSRPIWVTVDLLVANGSNFYFDDIKTGNSWVFQRKPVDKTLNGDEESSYTFIGTTQNKLMVVLASWSGGGTGVFYTLHVVDAVAAPGTDSDGTAYDRILLTNVRSIILGDRWQGEVAIRGDTIVVTTTAEGPGDRVRERKTMMIEAKR
jgi:hypothetical protein